MRPALLLLLFAASAGAAGVAGTRLRIHVDRRGSPPALAPSALPTFKSPAAALQVADDNPRSALGAWALLQWTKGARDEDQRARRRAVFQSRYPRSWILRAWKAQR